MVAWRYVIYLLVFKDKFPRNHVFSSIYYFKKIETVRNPFIVKRDDNMFLEILQ